MIPSELISLDGIVLTALKGSSLHAMRALKDPRWEDYNYEYTNKNGNRLYYLGNGITFNEQKEIVGGRKL